MDVKMGARTFTEEEAAKAAAGGEIRADLMKKARAQSRPAPSPLAPRRNQRPFAPHRLPATATARRGLRRAAQMLKVNKDAATPEELAQGGITKLRYLQFRDQSTTSTEVHRPRPPPSQPTSRGPGGAAAARSCAEAAHHPRRCS